MDLSYEEIVESLKLPDIIIDADKNMRRISRKDLINLGCVPISEDQLDHYIDQYIIFSSSWTELVKLQGYKKDKSFYFYRLRKNIADLYAFGYSSIYSLPKDLVCI